MISYNNKKISFDGCPSCAYAKHEFKLDCGIAYEDGMFILSQDWELPIEGFFIISPKKHIEKLSELSEEERNKMFSIICEVTKILRQNKICDKFDYIMEEKDNKHFHVLIIPRYTWMSEISEDIITNINTIFDYAKTNFKNDETYKRINTISEMVKKSLLNI